MDLKRIVIGIAVGFFVCGAVAQEQPSEGAAQKEQTAAAARELIEQAAAAIKELESLRYECKYTMSMGGAGVSIDVQATVQMMRDTENLTRWKQRTTGHAEDEKEKRSRVEVVVDGSLTKWIDDEKKQVVERLGRSKSAIITYAEQLQTKEITSRAPFAKILKDSKFSLGEETTVGGVACDVVLATNPQGSTTTWSLGKSDHLPRRMASNIMGMVPMALELTELEINPELVASDFEIETPPGYELKSQVPTQNTSKSMRTNASSNTPKVRRPGLEVNDIALAWEAQAADGTTVSLETMRNEVVVMWFWGTWSLESPSAADSLQESLDRFANKPIRVIALNVKERDNDAAAEFLNDGEYEFTLVLDAEELAELYMVQRYPAMFLIGYEGEIVHVVPGLSADEDRLAELNGAISEYFRAHRVPTKAEVGTSTPEGEGI